MNQNNTTTRQILSYEGLFSESITRVPRSFIREILKVANSKDTISFAGGLPNPDLFPVDAMREAAVRVLRKSGKESLQYSSTEGFGPLREYISRRYLEKQGLRIPPENILMTSGSQQGLDLLAKVFINTNDPVIIEEPGYLGAIQAFSVFRPELLPVPLLSDGMDIGFLERVLDDHSPKLMYVVPDFQNPSGISYSEPLRNRIAELIRHRNMILVEDTPYTEIRFGGAKKCSFYSLLPEQAILLGTFSKTAVPGFRMGWIVAPDEITEKLIIAKQAADLHSNTFTQMLLHDYLIHNDIDRHINDICRVYGNQRNAMVKALEQYFPEDIEFTRPDGGMFLWVKLSGGMSSMELFRRALKRKVAIVPGDPFYVRNMNVCSTLRLNFSCSDEETIDEGIRRIALALKNEE